jgi:hypothetical protein
MNLIRDFKSHEIEYIIESYNNDLLLETKVSDFFKNSIHSKADAIKWGSKLKELISGKSDIAKRVILTAFMICSMAYLNKTEIKTITNNIRTQVNVETAEQKAERELFINYEKDAEVYLKRDIFKGSPVTPAMLANAARKIYKERGVLVPLELALAQGQLESHMGKKGRQNHKTNPYNVGEYDKGTMSKFRTTQDGIIAYFDVMATDYLLKGEKTMEELLDNFVNINGARYASNTQYEKTLKGLTTYIRKYIDTNKNDKVDIDRFNIN